MQCCLFLDIHSPHSACLFRRSLPNFSMMLLCLFPRSDSSASAAINVSAKNHSDPQQTPNSDATSLPQKESKETKLSLLSSFAVHPSQRCSIQIRALQRKMLHIESIRPPLVVCQMPFDGSQRAQGRVNLAKEQKALLTTSPSLDSALLSFPSFPFLSPSFSSALILRSFALLWLLDNAPKKKRSLYQSV